MIIAPVEIFIAELMQQPTFALTICCFNIFYPLLTKRSENANFEVTLLKSVKSSVNHEEIKKQKRYISSHYCKQMRDRYATIIGTAEYDQVKKKCEISLKLLLELQRMMRLKIKCKIDIELLLELQTMIRLKKRIVTGKCTLKLNSNFEERIFKFTKQIQEGPYYVYVVWIRPVLLFKPEKYDIDIDQVYYEVCSFDGLFYVSDPLKL